MERSSAPAGGKGAAKIHVQTVCASPICLTAIPTPAIVRGSRALVYARRPGGVAQLGERLNGIQEVRGSIPLASTWFNHQHGATRSSSQNGSPEPCRSLAGIAQLVEHNLAKVGVAGSSPVSRFLFGTRNSDISRSYASDFARNSRESTLTRAPISPLPDTRHYATRDVSAALCRRSLSRSGG